MKNRIVILGAGQSGVGAAILGKKKGYEVFVSDIKGIDPDLQDFLNQEGIQWEAGKHTICLLYTSPSPRDRQKSRMPSSA